jgi:hypothetical protein
VKIQKYHFWLAFFFFVFGITFAMIIWTVKSAVATPVYEDKSFMTSYHDVDDNYNKMVTANSRFNQKYKTEVTINSKKVGMELSDLRYGQRSLAKRSTNQNILIEGENSLSISIRNRENNTSITQAKIAFQITRPIQDKFDINLDNFKLDGSIYTTTAKIEKAGNWNIIGKITIGDDIGYLYIKTNTKR